MKRGETGKLVVTVTGSDLASYKYFADIKSGAFSETVQMEYANGAATANITQDMSLKMSVTACTAEVRVIDCNGNVQISALYNFKLEKTIAKGAVSYE